MRTMAGSSSAISSRAPFRASPRPCRWRARPSLRPDWPGGRAGNVRRLDDRFQAPSSPCSPARTVSRRRSLPGSVVLPQLLVFEFQSVQTLEDRIVCHSLPFLLSIQGTKIRKAEGRTKFIWFCRGEVVSERSQSTKSRSRTKFIWFCRGEVSAASAKVRKAESRTKFIWFC